MDASKKNKILMAVGVVAVGLLVYLFVGGSAGGAMLADTATIRAYKIDGGFTGFAFAEISGFWRRCLQIFALLYKKDDIYCTIQPGSLQG